MHMAKTDEYYQEPEDIVFTVENIKLDRGVGKNAMNNFFKEFGRGAYYSAALCAQTALAVGNRGNVQIMSNMAVALAKEGKTAQIENAQEIYENALKIDPENAVIWINLGNLLLRRTYSKKGRYEDPIKARKAYENAVRRMKNFKNVDVWYYMGVACEKSRNEKDAIQCYRTAYLFNRNYTPVQFRLVALLYKEAGELAKHSSFLAKGVLNDALEIAEKNPKLEKYKKMLEKMEKELSNKISKGLDSKGKNSFLEDINKATKTREKEAEARRTETAQASEAKVRERVKRRSEVERKSAAEKEEKTKRIVLYCKDAKDCYNRGEYRKARDLFGKAIVEAVYFLSEKELDRIVDMRKKAVEELAKARKAGKIGRARYRFISRKH